MSTSHDAHRASTDEPSAPNQTQGRSNFVRDIIDQHLAQGHYQHPVTRFPPEPNGYLHIGHAKSICLNFGIARDYEGARCHLRFDDTNPVKEDTEYVESIQEDVRWLGFDWGEHLFFASDYYAQLYAHAQTLIKAGKAYICDFDEETTRAWRGTLREPGRPSPGRTRSVEENLDLFARMRAGEFKDGTYTLRALIDMSSPNMLMRDPILYRIRHVHHHRTGDAWCIYPMYDFAHCLSDAMEEITHSICTLEFENNRELYDWILNTLNFTPPRPHQYEFARLSLAYTIMSKRKLLHLVADNHVEGWDDPRMPTIAGMRRRGYTPKAVRDFCAMIGVAKANSTVDFEKLEFCVRNDLNHEAPRVLSVLRPLKVTLTNYPEGKTEVFDAPLWPHDIPREETRTLTFGRVLYIERDDFMEIPSKKFRRLSPGARVRLRHGYTIVCDDVVKDDEGNIVELLCSYDPESIGSKPSKVKGVIHWVEASSSKVATVRLYERLFSVENPGTTTGSFLDDINTNSLITIHDARVEASVAGDPAGTRYQFERRGYFVRDQDSTDETPVFNRIVALKSSWSPPKTKPQPTQETAAQGHAQKSADNVSTRVRPEKKSRAQIRAMLRANSPELQARFARYQDTLGLSEEDADLLTGDVPTGDLFEAALRGYDNTEAVTKWFVNDMMRALKEEEVATLSFSGEDFGRLVALVERDDALTGAAAREVLDEMVASGRPPETIIEERGLQKVSDADALQVVVDEAIAKNAGKVDAYRSGKKGLLGFFMGQVMRATGGTADAALVRRLLTQSLDG